MSMFKKVVKSEPETIACYRCGHIVLKSSAAAILHNHHTNWFCMDHRPAYDEPYNEYSSLKEHYTYWKKMRVDKLDVPIGYVKVAE